jgi:hypothetical protein
VSVVVTIDPGTTTGVARVKSSGHVVETFVDRYPFDTLRNYLRRDLCGAKVVCESGPGFGRHNTFHLESVEQIVRDEVDEVTWVSPGQWKGTPAASSPVSRGLTQHERDAVRLARWYMTTKERACQ